MPVVDINNDSHNLGRTQFINSAWKMNGAVWIPDFIPDFLFQTPTEGPAMLYQCMSNAT